MERPRTARRRGGWPRGAVPGAALLAALVVAGACATAPPARAPEGADDASQRVTGTVLVSAAASLTDVFGAIADAFESAHPGIKVVLNLGGSASLREQILAGAPADVLAAASLSSVDEVVAAGAAASPPVVFARNRLVIAVPAGNPAGVAALSDLADPSLLVGLCAEGVPCGDLAREALTRAGVEAAVDTSEPNVRALLTKIAAGELDAGITYVTDLAAAAGEVEGVAIPDEANAIAQYPIVALAGAPNPTAAAAFVAFVGSAPAQAILRRAGFVAP